jgi:selenocysteine lyase/cysteine desulfurase
MSFNSQQIRKDFPTIGSDAIYLDSATSSLTPPAGH